MGLEAGSGRRGDTVKGRRPEGGTTPDSLIHLPARAQLTGHASIGTSQAGPGYLLPRRRVCKAIDNLPSLGGAFRPGLQMEESTG